MMRGTCTECGKEGLLREVAKRVSPEEVPLYKEEDDTDEPRYHILQLCPSCYEEFRTRRLQEDTSSREGCLVLLVAMFFPTLGIFVSLLLLFCLR